MSLDTGGRRLEVSGSDAIVKHPRLKASSWESPLQEFNTQVNYFYKKTDVK